MSARRATLAAVVTVVTALVVTPAQAAQVSHTAGSSTFTLNGTLTGDTLAAGYVTRGVGLEEETVLQFRSPGGMTEASPSCVLLSGTAVPTVECVPGPGPTRVIIIGTSGGDTLVGFLESSVPPLAPPGVEFEGQAGNDRITGTIGPDTIAAGAGNDAITPGRGDDGTVDCGSENDTVSYDDGRSASEGVTVDLGITAATPAGNAAVDGNEFLSGCENAVGSAGADTLTARQSGSRLEGLGGADTLIGSFGNDTLVPGAGADQEADGKDGFDTVSYDYPGRPGRVEADLLDLTGTNVIDAGDAERLVAVEALVGSSGDDVLRPAVAGRVDARGGNDTVTGADGAEILNGEDGDDLLTGGLAADVVSGGAGTGDTVSYADGRSAGVTVGLGAGTFPDGDTGSGLEHVVGSTGDDTLTGSGGDNRLEGRGGADTLTGADGNDTLVPGAGTDATVTGGTGQDTLSFDDGRAAGVTASLATGLTDADGGESFTGVDALVGSPHADVLTGSDQADRLEGLAGGDRLEGLAGLDALFGGEGVDTLLAKDGLGGETVDCGPGSPDSATIDASDVASSCDADGDGVEAETDCDDADAARKPGGTEVPGNGVDEDCSGADTPAPVLTATPAATATATATPTAGPSGPPATAPKALPSKVTSKVRRARRTVVFTRLEVTALPAGATVVLACTSKSRAACPLKARTYAIKTATAKLALASAFKKRKLPTGTVIRITISAPGFTGLRTTITVRTGKPPLQRTERR